MIEKLSDILIITDIDGTLLREKDGISKNNVAAIKRFVKKGGHFTVSTGRAYDVTEALIRDVPINAPSVHINGGYFYDWDKKKILCPNYISNNAAGYCKKIVEKFPFCDCHFAGKSAVTVLTSGEVLHKYLPHREIIPFNGSYDDVPENVYKFIICCEPEHMKEVRSFAASVCKNDVALIQSSPFFLEMLPPQNSKGASLKKLCEMLDIPLENSVAAGDYENDIEMIQTAGLGAAVDNAQERLKDAADIILPPCEEDAIAELIGFLEEMYG